MTKCWQESPDERPTFTELRNELKEMENQHKVKLWGVDFVKINFNHKTALGMFIGSYSEPAKRRLPFAFVAYNALKKPSERIDQRPGNISFPG